MIIELSIAGLQAKAESLAKGRVCILGDLMLDEYLIGDAERISPEAPVPVVHVREERTVLGGAANVARNVAALGGHVHLIGLAGLDRNGDKLEELLHQRAISATVIRTADRPTTIKTRVLARQQQMLRIDRESPQPCADDARTALLSQLAPLLREYPVLILSDYGKGIISTVFMQGLREILAGMPEAPRILVDPKTPNFHLYSDMFLLTPNSKETSEGAGLPVDSPQAILAAGRRILERLGCEHLLTTLGPLGMALFEDREMVWHIPTVARKVFDVTGAGDTVIATAALGVSAGLDLLDACILANYAAGVVVGEVGAGVVDQDALKSAISSLGLPDVRPWTSEQAISSSLKPHG